MEELRTTEVLDREILEDARKKAYKILKTADDTLAVQKSDWEKKLNDTVETVRNAYSERENKINTEVFARLPLDKRRLRSETAERFLVKAMNDFLRSLKRETLLSVLKNDLSEKLKACDTADISAGGKEKIYYSGMDLCEARELLEKVMNTHLNDPDFSEDKENHEFPFMGIDTQNLKITASVEDAAIALLKDKRAELAAALLGEGVLSD